MADERFDVAICGSGPAGTTAGIILARNERRVVIAESHKLPQENSSCVWVSARVEPLLEELGIRDHEIFNDSFADVTFHSSDFSKTIRPTFDKPAGFLLNRGDLHNLLVHAARKAGVTIIDSCPIETIRLEESRSVIVSTGGDEIDSQLLLIATGRGSQLVKHCGFKIGGGTSVLWAARVNDDNAAESKPLVHVVLGLNKKGSFGMICRKGTSVSVSVHWSGDRSEATPALITLCKMARDHELISLDLAQRSARSAVLASPASAALEHDSHVGKHSLLIGDAGGFVSAASDEGIYPAMWSAKIASEVVNSALNEQVFSQDELMSFDAKWRIEMADYLRSPNTDPQFLLPLIFSNQAMADRMGAALFFGENI